MPRSEPLETFNPALYGELHHAKNQADGIVITSITPGSHKAVWWQCKQHENHVWLSVVSNRRNGAGCPYCLNQKVLAGYNDLATVNADLASEWNYTRNTDLSPQMVTGGSNKLVWWTCRKDSTHEWEARICDRSRDQKRCPNCPRPISTSLGLTLKERYPDIAKFWHPTKNGKLTPSDIHSNSSKYVWWICDVDPLHEWKSRVGKKVNQVRCVICHGTRVIAGVNDLSTINPKLAYQWHPTMNGELLPTMITEKSKKKIWWICPDNPLHYWNATVTHRSQGKGCSLCASKTVIAGINDLATVSPEVAKLWHPTKNGDLSPTMFSEFSGKMVWWQCNQDISHVYYKSIGSKAICEICYGISMSKIQHDFELAIVKYIGDIKGNVKLMVPWKKNRSMRVDIYSESLNLVIEYDGEYFHNGKCSGKSLQHHLEHDGAKTQALLNNGYRVIRIRENSLEHLPIVDENLYQLSHRNGSGILITVEQLLSVISSKMIIKYNR